MPSLRQWRRHPLNSAAKVLAKNKGAGPAIGTLIGALGNVPGMIIGSNIGALIEAEAQKEENKRQQRKAAQSLQTQTQAALITAAEQKTEVSNRIEAEAKTEGDRLNDARIQLGAQREGFFTQTEEQERRLNAQENLMRTIPEDVINRRLTDLSNHLNQLDADHFRLLAPLLLNLAHPEDQPRITEIIEQLAENQEQVRVHV